MTHGVSAARLERLDWPAIARQLDERGHAVTPPLLTAAECRAVGAMWNDAGRFRSHIDMARHRFGVGEYRYFAEPLPAVVARLRTWAYARLAPTANRWTAALGRDERFPETLAAFTTYCAARGQHRPTPLLLRYAAGGYNCLHQDIYGDVAFPLQVTVMLSVPGEDFTGGENVFVEQRPRAQSRPVVASPRRGEALIFPTRDRPVPGKLRPKRVVMRHGVSTVHTGERTTLGVIFHNAR
jgi:hypothetical protein